GPGGWAVLGWVLQECAGSGGGRTGRIRTTWPPDLSAPFINSLLDARAPGNMHLYKHGVPGAPELRICTNAAFPAPGVTHLYKRGVPRAGAHAPDSDDRQWVDRARHAAGDTKWGQDECEGRHRCAHQRLEVDQLQEVDAPLLQQRKMHR